MKREFKKQIVRCVSHYSSAPKDILDALTPWLKEEAFDKQPVEIFLCPKCLIVFQDQGCPNNCGIQSMKMREVIHDEETA